MAQHYLNNPPAHGAHAGLTAKMNMLVYLKGLMWVCKIGVDMNLDVQFQCRDFFVRLPFPSTGGSIQQPVL